jgi:hypothetical protein
MTYEVLWEMASNHPESGICKMPCVDYYTGSLQDAGLIRKDQTEVWYKDIVHDVFLFTRFSDVSSGYFLAKNYLLGQHLESASQPFR